MPPPKRKRTGAETPQLTTVWNKTKKPRPRALKGRTYNIQTPVGKAFVTINENGNNQPFEIFLNTAKAGSETAAVSEAIGRLLSYTLRLASPVAPRQRLKEIYRQLRGIGGSRTSGFGPNRVSSLPDGVAKVVGEYIEETKDEHPDEGAFLPVAPTNGKSTPAKNGKAKKVDIQQVGDMCPECGHAAVINEEGCRKCYNCAYSEC